MSNLNKLLLTGLLTLSLGSVQAQAGGAGRPMPMPLPTAAPSAITASATLRDPAGTVQGTARFVPMDGPMGGGLHVTVEVRGLTPGQHGMHFHEFGRCTPGIDAATNKVVAFGGAGGHFDPGMSKNHDTPQTDNRVGHAGDLPAITVGADGVGRADFMTGKDALSGETGVLNRSLVIHAMPDDYKSDPSGMTGARERCGVVVRDGFAARDYVLPGPTDFPEGIAYDARKGVIYTGSAQTGTIYAVNANNGAVSKFQEGGALGRASALGLKVDGQGRLWIAGGAQGTVSVLSPDGMTVAVIETPKSPEAYLNDLTLAPNGNVYVTDSNRPVLFRITPDLKVSAWLDLSRTPIRYGPGLNLNGIVATPDGQALLAVQLNTGDLWRIDLKTRVVSRVMGGLTNGDGLLLDGRTLYAVRNKNGLIVKIALSADYRSGRVVAEEPVTGLRFPSTLTLIGTDLVSTQAQLDKLQGGSPETPFKLTRFKKF